MYHVDSGDVLSNCFQKQFSMSQGFQCFVMLLSIPRNINFSFEQLCLKYILEGKTRNETLFLSEKHKETSFQL